MAGGIRLNLTVVLYVQNGGKPELINGKCDLTAPMAE